MTQHSQNALLPSHYKGEYSKHAGMWWRCHSYRCYSRTGTLCKLRSDCIEVSSPLDAEKSSRHWKVDHHGPLQASQVSISVGLNTST